MLYLEEETFPNQLVVGKSAKIDNGHLNPIYKLTGCNPWSCPEQADLASAPGLG
jgi:hypothetical protein